MLLSGGKRLLVEQATPMKPYVGVPDAVRANHIEPSECFLLTIAVYSQ